ncbi:SDR family oxidoreductase [Buchnera aphidicola (Sarucallis kahawaluokalani)]|uniref:3-oxoacyl-[acyl-carrier-protein] reductase FabG n=1 Tax=Buchnera aphidicola (Sarucallis kahawaluokalani) TaxID=1241878 RepID=A0A4D6YJR0_9GAMM|nr:SDR family oxidoreductase [Buchnera aphidicola (Sarucallis kahawaluokalani)]
MQPNKQIALVTGANRGLGKKIAKVLSQNNILVIGTATSIQGKKIIDQELKNHGFGIVLNLNNLFQVSQIIKNIYHTFQRIDILINNAAIKKDQLLINTNLENWMYTLQINLTAVFYITKLTVKKMIKKKYGRIITIGSVIGNIGNIGQVSYATSKSGLIGFNKTLALEVATHGITSNIIAPGVIKSGMFKTMKKSHQEKYLSKIPMKRFGTPQDIASAVLFLISKNTSYITGQTIHINGGIYMN